MLTLSRGTVVGLGAGLVSIILTERRRSLRPVLVGSLVALVAVAGIVHFARGRIETGLESKADVARQNVDFRLAAWSAAGRFAVDHPFLGIGPGNFRIRYPEYSELPVGVSTLNVVHNSFLDIGGEDRAARHAPVHRVSRARLPEAWVFSVRQGRGPPDFAIAARTSLVVGIAASFTLTEQYFAPFWLLGGLAVALSRDTPVATSS